MKDKLLITQHHLEKLIRNENRRQIEKWGVQDRSSFEWLAYLIEEVGELSNAISENFYRHGDAENIVKEAIQVATLALKIAEMNDPDLQERALETCK